MTVTMTTREDEEDGDEAPYASGIRDARVDCRRALFSKLVYAPKARDYYYDYGSKVNNRV
jgi:hypothetical protein